MPLPYQPWRAAMVPASFAGCGFYVQQGGFAGGRRIAEHEYPKKNTPYGEDTGRKARRWQMTGYVIGPDYIAARDALIAACEAEGPATLVHPTLGTQQVHCDTCSPVESWDKGGLCTFELVFFEAGQDPDASATADTQAQASAAAQANGDTTASTLDGNLAGQGGIGSDAVASANASSVTPIVAPSNVGDFPTAYPTSVGASSLTA